MTQTRSARYLAGPGTAQQWTEAAQALAEEKRIADLTAAAEARIAEATAERDALAKRIATTVAAVQAAVAG